MTDRLDLPFRYRRELEALLREHVPDTEVWAYGSRVTGESHPASDLDLVLRGPSLERLGHGFSDFLEALEESNIPILVQAHDWARLPESFHREIERDYVVVQNRNKPTTAGHWAEITLGDVCTKIGSGATPRGGKEVYLADGPYALIRSQNVYNAGFARDGLAFISDEQAEALQNAEVFSNDVLLNITGDSVARVCQVDSAVLPARVNQHVAIVRTAPDKLDATYLRYYLAAPGVQSTLLSWAGSGGTRNALTKQMIEAFEVRGPADLGEQRAIAHVLGTLDDKIELNRRMNETLEEMARALFKSWFVDFDPVRAKMEGRDTGLPPDIADLFPDRLVPSELGEIPQGWEVKELGQVVEVVGGTTPSTNVAEYWSGGTHCWATPKDLSGLSAPVLLDTERKITDAGLAKIGSGLLPKGTVLLSSRAPIGYLAVSEEPMAINQGFIGMPPGDGISNLFLLHWCKAFHEEIINHANGSTFLEISKGNFRHIPISIAGEAVMNAFGRQVRSLHQRIVANERDARSLATQRDALLPKLVSGEVRIRGAKNQVGAAHE